MDMFDPDTDFSNLRKSLSSIFDETSKSLTGLQERITVYNQALNYISNIMSQIVQTYGETDVNMLYNYLVDENTTVWDTINKLNSQLEETKNQYANFVQRDAEVMTNINVLSREKTELLNRLQHYKDQMQKTNAFVGEQQTNIMNVIRSLNEQNNEIDQKLGILQNDLGNIKTNMDNSSNDIQERRRKLGIFQQNGDVINAAMNIVKKIKNEQHN